MNPFDEYLDKLLDHLNFLNGLLSTFDHQLENFRDLYNKYIEQDKLDEAVKLYRQGLPFAPDSALMHYDYGCLLAKQGHKQEAIEELHIAGEIDPDFIPPSKEVEELLNK